MYEYHKAFKASYFVYSVINISGQQCQHNPVGSCILPEFDEECCSVSFLFSLWRKLLDSYVDRYIFVSDRS